jgi:hypothetical protein
MTQEELHKLLEYNLETGEFFWKISVAKKIKPGKKAGQVCKIHGYETIGIKGKNYKSHRLAWMYVYGKWPEIEIDHINRIKTDNRICNLRDVTRSINNLNRNTIVRKPLNMKGKVWTLDNTNNFVASSN